MIPKAKNQSAQADFVNYVAAISIARQRHTQYEIRNTEYEIRNAEKPHA